MDYLAAVGDGRLGRSQNPMSQTSARALVVGMGATGLSIARHFLRQGFQVAAADSRMSPPCKKEFADLPGAECRCGEDFRNWRAEDFRNFARIGKSPGAPMEWLAAAMDSDSNSDSQKIVGDAGLFAESLEENPLPIKILAATGANGKSTVVALLAAMCREAGLARGGYRQHRLAAVGCIGGLAGGDGECDSRSCGGGVVQFSIGGDCAVSVIGGGGAECQPRPFGSPRHFGKLHRRQGANLSRRKNASD